MYKTDDVAHNNTERQKKRKWGENLITYLRATIFHINFGPCIYMKNHLYTNNDSQIKHSYIQLHIARQCRC